MAVLAFFLNVVPLNLLISIMGDSYGQVLEMRERTDALTRLEMISEAAVYKKFLKHNHQTKRECLVHCLPVGLERDEDGQNHELEGNIVKAMQKFNEQNNVDSKQEFKKLQQENEVPKNEILELKSYLQNEFSKMKK